MKKRLLRLVGRTASALVRTVTTNRLRIAVLGLTEAVYDTATHAVYNPAAQGTYDLQREGTYAKKDSYVLPKGRYILTKRDDMTYDLIQDFQNEAHTYDSIWSSQDFLDKNYLDPARLKFFSEVADRIVTLAKTVQSSVRIIDVGVGPGDFLLLLTRRLGEGGIDGRLFGTDYSDASIERCRRLVPEGRFEVGNIHDLPYADESFDIVLCMEVLEHIQHVRKAVAQLTRIARPGGYLVITVPNGELDCWIGHINFWSADEFAALLSDDNQTIPLVAEFIDEGRTMCFQVAKPADGSPRAIEGA